LELENETDALADRGWIECEGKKRTVTKTADNADNDGEGGHELKADPELREKGHLEEGLAGQTPADLGLKKWRTMNVAIRAGLPKWVSGWLGYGKIWENSKKITGGRLIVVVKRSPCFA
jgi:hypothetical protein